MSHLVTVPASMPWPSRSSFTWFAIGPKPFRLSAGSPRARRSACGITYCSMTGAKASGANFAPTRSIGASR